MLRRTVFHCLDIISGIVSQYTCRYRCTVFSYKLGTSRIAVPIVGSSTHSASGQRSAVAAIDGGGTRHGDVVSRGRVYRNGNRFGTGLTFLCNISCNTGVAIALVSSHGATSRVGYAGIASYGLRIGEIVRRRDTVSRRSGRGRGRRPHIAGAAATAITITSTIIRSRDGL